VVASIVASHLILTATFLSIGRAARSADRPWKTASWRGGSASGATPATERHGCSPPFARGFRSWTRSLPQDSLSAANEPDGLSLRSLHRRLGSNYDLFAPAHEGRRPQDGIGPAGRAMIYKSSCGTSGNVRSGWGRGCELCLQPSASRCWGLWAARALTAPTVVVRKAAETSALTGPLRRFPHAA